MPDHPPHGEAARLEALARYAILDTEPEAAFDDLARLAAQICGTPIALISLVDAERQWSKAFVGIGSTETPFPRSFCAHAIRQRGLVVVPDAAADGRFAADPLVADEPGLRFYAAAPLVTPDGFALGVLCVGDRVSRRLSAAQAEALEALGRQVVAQLELRLHVARLRDCVGEATRAANALRGSEAEARKLAMVASRTDNAVIITDADGRIEWVNDGFARVTGYRLEEVKGRKPGAFLQGPETDPETVRMIRGRLAAGQGFKADIVNYSRSGRRYWLAIDAQPIRDEAGALTHFVAIESDITERKLMEEERRRAHEDQLRANDELEARVRERTAELREQASALRRAEEGFRGLFENAAEGIFQTTPDGRYLRTNPALARIFGFETPAELAAELSDVGRQLYVDPGRREEFRQLIGENGVLGGFESPVRRKDGEVIWIRENARAVLGPDGVLQYYEGFVEDITERKRAEGEIHALHAELERAYDATIEGWARALDLRDKETEGHSRRVTEMSLRLARALGLGEEELIHVRRGALLHDIGKLGVPDAVLLKPGELTAAEWEVMRRHPTYAHDWLASIPVLRPALAIPHGHHERWDGTGYPRGLAGEEIPLAARLFAAVDIWDALRSDRPYRRAWPEGRVREHLRSLAGSHLDPAVVEAFLRVLDGATGFEDPGPAATPSLAESPGQGGRMEGLLRTAVDRVRELELANARLAELAATDELTGLRNRRHFREALGDACAGAPRHGRPLTLILLDLDGFKAYNDAHGHPAGDEVLRSVAAILRVHVRPGDVVARHGGEEFAVLMPETGAQGGIARADRLRAAIAAHRWPMGAVTASFGVATMLPDVVAADLVEQADRALYFAKRLGRDRVAHHEDLSGWTLDRPLQAV